MTKDPQSPELHRPPERPHPLLSRPGPDLPTEVGPLVVRQPRPEETVAHRAAVDSAYGFPFRPQEPAQEGRMDASMPPHNRRVVVEALPDGGERISAATSASTRRCRCRGRPGPGGCAVGGGCGTRSARPRRVPGAGGGAPRRLPGAR